MCFQWSGGVILLLYAISTVLSHPQCLDFQAPFEASSTRKMCSSYSNYTCCTGKRDSELYWKYFGVMEDSKYAKFESCSEFLKQLLCTECNPFAAHIFDSEAKPKNPLKFPGLCPQYCKEFFEKCPELISKLTNDSRLISAAKESANNFCNKIRLSDQDYCFPKLLANPVLTGDLDRAKSSEDGCLCVEKKVDKLRNPVFGVFSRKSAQRFYVLEQKGLIWTYQLPEWKKVPQAFLDIQTRVHVSTRLADERGLLGLAFHPDFESNRRFYVYYTGQKDKWSSSGHSQGRFTTIRISEFHVFPYSQPYGIPMGDPNSEKILIEVPKPSNFWNHNGGMIMFGVDRFLYAVLGDGGAGGDPFNHAQNKNTLLGTAIRIDVSNPATAQVKYRIPADNPFVGMTGRKEEIFAYGLRNAWRCSVDRGDPAGKNRGRIFCGDVGQDAFEEIDIIKNGGNYGWRAKEGFNCYNRQECAALRGDVLPIYAYPHSVGKSITGGYVYRGCRNTNLKGLYIYGDYVTGRLYRLKETSNGQWQNKEIRMCTANLCTNNLQNNYEPNILSFAEDYNGEIYIMVTRRPSTTSTEGVIYRLVDPRRRDDPESCVFSEPI